ncbi:MAG: glycogen debranching protein, partial [Bacteroidota bacterium]
MRKLACLFLPIVLISCDSGSPESSNSLEAIFADFPSYSGSNEYAASPYVTAGDRLYMVGFQDGSFPDYGWHVEGEMAGIWDHPIKLMDGFSFAIAEGENDLECLPTASSFINFPIGNQLNYDLPDKTLKLTQTQFVPDGEEGIIIELTIENTSKEEKSLSVGFTGRVDLTPVWLAERLEIVDGQDETTWSNNKVIATDANNSWFTIFGSDQTEGVYKEGAFCTQERKGLGTDASILNQVNVEGKASSTIRYVIAGSYLSQ